MVSLEADWYRLHYIHIASYLVGGLIIGIFTPRSETSVPIEVFFLPFAVAFAIALITGLATFPAYYFDAKYLKRNHTWTPPWKLFVATAILGTPLLASSLYLWKRRQELPEATGIPLVGSINWSSLIVASLALFSIWWISLLSNTDSISYLLVWPGIITMHLKPFFYYFDAKSLKKQNSDYEPYWHLYAILFFLPGPPELIYTIQRTRHTLLD